MAAKSIPLRESIRAVYEHGEQGPHADRPRIRADCAAVPRPCPWITCRHNLSLDVTSAGGIRFTQHDASKAKPSCSLDEAALGPKKYEEIGAILGLTRERIRQEADRALARLADAGILQDSPPGGLEGDSEYTQAPIDEALAAFGLDGETGEASWLKKALSEADSPDVKLW